MVAAPQYGCFVLTSPKGVTRHLDAYFSDVVGAHVRFDQGSGAGAASQEKVRIPFAGFITDMSILTGMTDTTAVQIIINNAPTGDWIRYNTQLNTAERPSMCIPVQAGQEFSAIQRA